MNLNFGSGDAAAILDLSTCKVEMYNEAGLEDNPFHARFGGRQYYTSRSGLSGAGWIPDRPSIRPVGVLRADVSRPRVPAADETLPGVRVVVCTTHLKRDEQLPLIVVRDHEVTIVGESDLRGALLGTLETSHAHEVILTSWVPWGTMVMAERKLTITVHSNGRALARWGKLSLRRVLELLFWNELFEKEASIVYADQHEPALEDLGLHRGIDGRLYRQVGGILRHQVEETAASLECETGQKFYHVGEGNTLAYVDEDNGQWGDGGFRLRHTAERSSFVGGPQPVELTIEQALEIFSSESLPEWALEAVAASGTPEQASVKSCPEGHEAWECELLGCEHFTPRGEVES